MVVRVVTDRGVVKSVKAVVNSLEGREEREKDTRPGGMRGEKTKVKYRKMKVIVVYIIPTFTCGWRRCHDDRDNVRRGLSLCPR